MRRIDRIREEQEQLNIVYVLSLMSIAEFGVKEKERARKELEWTKNRIIRLRCLEAIRYQHNA